MSRFRLIRHLLATASTGGGGSSLTPVYDTRWGTSTDANGWITFGLKPGCRRVWVDSINGNDAHDGLSAATAQKTYNVAFSTFTGSGAQPGDQLMIAGTGGRTYTDTTGQSLTPIASQAGGSATYMTAVLSYDPADPTNAAKYGKLVGVDMPILNYDGGTSLNVVNADGAGYCAVQGLEVKGTASRAIDAPAISIATNNHPGIVWQNFRWNGVSFSYNPATGTNDAAHNTQNAGLLSKGSMFNGGGFFTESADAFYVQGFIPAHNGWNVGSTRQDPIQCGGPQVFTHNFYYHASCTNGRFDRIVTVDSSLEGLGIRGDIAGASQIVAIDNPFGYNAGSFSSSYTEAPNGVHFYLDDGVIMGSDICTPNNPGGVAVQWNNTLAGSYIRNIAAFDYEKFDDHDTTYNRYAVPGRNDAAQVPQYMLLDKWSGWRWAPTEISSTYPSVPIASGSGDLVNVHQSWSNSTLDVNPTGLNGSVSNSSQRTSAPAAYKTRAQVYSALGFSSKAALVNAMLWRPDLPWAEAICSIALPAMGLTPQYPSVGVPTFTGTPPSYYPTALATLTLSQTSVTRGTPAVILVNGLSANSDLSCSDLPTGFSNSFFSLSTSGNATSGSNQITSVANVTGITPGMYLDVITPGNARLTPVATYVVAVSGSTITLSQNCSATQSGCTVNIAAGGRAIRYDGTGSASTPIIHLVETSKDTLGTNTTPITLTIS